MNDSTDAAICMKGGHGGTRSVSWWGVRLLGHGLPLPHRSLYYAVVEKEKSRSRYQRNQVKLKAESFR